MRLPRVGSLRTRVLLLVLLAVVPALAMILYDGLAERRAAGERARRDALEIARGAVQDQRRLMLETAQLLAVVARLPQVRGAPEECSATLRELVAQGSPYANLGVVRPDGEAVCAVLPFEPGLSLADRSWFRRVVETGRFSIGDYQVGRITGVASINFAYPIPGPGAPLEGVLYAALPLAWLQDRIAAAELPAGSAVTVLDSSLTVLARYPGGERWIGRHIRNSALGSHVRDVGGEATFQARGLDGVRRLYAVVPLDETTSGSSTFLAVGIPASAAFDDAERGLARNLAGLTLLTLVIAGAAWWGSELVVLRPVRSLLRATRRLGDGELDARAPVSSHGGEIAELASSFNDMAGRLHYVANYDPVTELANRALYTDRLEQALGRAKQESRFVGVLSVSVDSFAEVDASMGRAVSDELLGLVAAYLTGAAREGDTVARLGGDEFGVALPDLPRLIDVETLATEIVRGAPRMLTVAGQEIFLTFRTGAAVYPNDGDDAATLVRSASLARRSATPAGAGPVCFFSADINARVQRRQVVEQGLRHALERDELTLHYQPVVDIARREVVGVEALIRWHSAELGDLSPVHFIPVAEETGLITQIGEWIVETAVDQLKAWHARGLGRIRINVNVSVDQLRQPGFVDRITEILDAKRFDPSALLLGIEITESELMENLGDAIVAIHRFRQMGMSVYIDDFGTGYSSLSYLRELPIDTLKIDASFIRDLPGDADAVAVVKGILAMARSLELRVIAEGVETEEQFDVLRLNGCDAVQGYLFSRPVPPEEVERLFGRVLAPA